MKHNLKMKWYAGLNSASKAGQRPNLIATRVKRRQFGPLALIIPCLPVAGAVYHADATNSTSLAVVRPFCVSDAMQLAESFDIWDTFPPCDPKESSHMAALFLVFSQSIESSLVAADAVDSVLQRFTDTDGWESCFDRVVTIDAGIPSEEDIYRPIEQAKNAKWVNGPNRQFEKAIREVQTGLWGDYEVMYLMEGDSVPVKPYWLGSLETEIEKRRPFAILGRYV